MVSQSRKEANVANLIRDARKKRYRPVVVAVIRNKKGEILLVRSMKRPREWYFPQGGVEIGETARRALFRELSEELSLKRSDLALERYLGYEDVERSTVCRESVDLWRGKRYFFYRLSCAREAREPVPDRVEVLECQWVLRGKLKGKISRTRKEKQKFIKKYHPGR